MPYGRQIWVAGMRLLNALRRHYKLDLFTWRCLRAGLLNALRRHYKPTTKRGYE